MKKITALCLLLILVFSFSACGTNPAPEGSESQDAQQVSEQTARPSETTAEGKDETMRCKKSIPLTWARSMTGIKKQEDIMRELRCHPQHS